ncbi:hypothetical protein Asp14428_53670 [Actinoplanes sp. NBRC 14428]|nr:hypothetical protein Asp14428_53670 [Actinoplanes sp. NBRC 14428]
MAKLSGNPSQDRWQLRDHNGFGGGDRLTQGSSLTARSEAIPAPEAPTAER